MRRIVAPDLPGHGQSARWHPPEDVSIDMYRDAVGTVCAGCVADLVVLNADPLRDIRNTRRIALVVADGRAYSPTALAALRESALRAARSRAKSQ